MSRSFLPLAVAALMSIAAARAQAQQAGGMPASARYAIGVVAGATQFDLSGTGTTAVIGVRAEDELKRWLVGEAALGFFRPTQQSGGERPWYSIPEAQLQLQLPLGAVRPYIGAGGGWVIASGNTTGTASGAAGLRAMLPAVGLDARAELRVRGISRSFSGSTAEWTLGLARRF